MNAEKEVYRRYAAETSVVTVGESQQDDIQICRRGSCRIRIDRRKKCIEVPAAEKAVMYNGQRITERCGYAGGGILSCGPLKIILHDAFLMIREDPDIIVHLPPADDRADLVLRFAPLRTGRIDPQMIAEIPSDTIRVPVPKKANADLPEPSFLNYLPVLLMSAAGLLSTVFAAASGSGTPLTAWIMPVSMLAVNALLFPLRRIAWKNEVRRKQRKEAERIREQRQESLAEMEQFASGFRQKTDTVFPSPEQLCQQANSGTAGFRDSRSPAYGKIRLGETDADIRIELEVGNEPDTESFRMLAVRAREIQRIAGPWIIDLAEYRTIRIRFTEMQALYFRYLLLQAAVYFRSTEHVFVFAVSHDTVLKSVRDLPHVISENGLRFLVKDVRDAADAVIELQKEQRTVVLFAETGLVRFFSDIQAIRIILDEKDCEYSGKTDLDLTVDSFAATAVDHLRGRERLFLCDLPSDIAAFTDRYFAGLSCTGYALPQPTYMQMLKEAGCDTVHIRENWRRSDPDSSISGLIGRAQDQNNIFLDLHERGDGPHGLLAGTTGSGKSELLITMILSLAVKYAPWDLQFVIIDFKGGASVQAFDSAKGRLPHLASSLTDLDVTDMKRAVAALQAECRWREQCFRDLHKKSGRPVTSISRYRCLQKQYRAVPPLAHLVIIADEYAELKQSYPEFPDELVRIARIGRSLGMHLLLCTQKPSGTVNDQIRSNTAYKICLKTADRQDSMEVIQCADAAYLNEPGAFYLVTDQKRIRGKACYSREAMTEGQPRVQLFDHMHRVKADSAAVTGTGMTVLEGLTERILQSSGGYRAQSIWHSRPRHPSLRFLAQTKGAFALADDTVRRRILPLTLSEGCGHLFFTSDRRAKQNCVFAVIWALVRGSSIKDELYVIDDLYMGLEGLLGSSDHTAVFPSSDTEKLRETCDRIRRRTHDTENMCTVIITDCTRFYECAAAAEVLHDLLEHGQDHRVNIIMFAAGGGSVYYRDMSLITDRYYLSSDNLNDISSVMETVVRVPVKRWDEGLCRRGGLMEFYLPSVSAEQLKTAAEQIGKGENDA